MGQKKSPAHFAKQAQEAYELSLAGYSQRQIAEKMGIALATVQRRLDLYIKDRVHPKADEYRARQIDRAQIYIRSLWSAILAGDPKAIAQAVRTEERISKLLGLDSATQYKVEVEPSDKYTDQLTVFRLLRGIQEKRGKDTTKTDASIAEAEERQAKGLPPVRRTRPLADWVKNGESAPSTRSGSATPKTVDEFADTFAAHEVQPEAFRIAEDLEEFEPERPEPLLNARDIQNARKPTNNNHKLLRDYDD